MDISTATSVQMVSPKYGFAIYEGEYDAPTVHFLIKMKSGDYQQTCGWFLDTLLERNCICHDMFDEKEVGLYIDYGQNWFIPAGPFACAQGFFREYKKGSRFNEVLTGKVW